MASDETVEVVYALPDTQTIVSVKIRNGLTVRQAFELSGLAGQHDDIDPDNVVLGLNGNLARPDDKVAGGDRVEICRPLVVDPRQMRFERVAQGRVMGGGSRPPGGPVLERAGDESEVDPAAPKAT